MAQKVIVKLISDLSGNEGDETLTFAFDGKSYEIDLTSKEADEFRASMEQYVKAGRRVTGAKGRVGGSRQRAREQGMIPGPDPKAVRAWAASNNIKVSDRGRIPADVVDKYLAAGNS